MSEVKFSLLSNYRTYGIELRERNYPTFEGRYNAYISCYGQLSGSYLGCIDSSFAMDIEDLEVYELANKAEKFINDHKYTAPVICNIQMMQDKVHGKHFEYKQFNCNTIDELYALQEQMIKEYNATFQKVN